jgi:hypothetical protein
MAEAPVIASPDQHGSYPTSPLVSSPRRARAASARARAKPSLAVSEARRAWNIERAGVVSELRCECGLPACRETVPGIAERYRGTGDHFVLRPPHFRFGVVVRAADRFFVVDSGLHGMQARNGLR